MAAVVRGYVAAAHGGHLALHSQQQPLMEAGLDSLDLLKACAEHPRSSVSDACPRCAAMALNWLGARGQMASLLGSEFGLALPPTLVFDFPTLESLAMYLASSLQVCLQRQLAALLSSSVMHGSIMVIRAMMSGFGIFSAGCGHSGS